MKYLILLMVLLWSTSLSRGQATDSVVTAVGVLTIHVRDTNTHHGVLGLLTRVMQLPLEYGPELHGTRLYAAVYAGNMFIEPCGPYPANKYPKKDFQALFYGLNCTSTKPPSVVASHLERLGITHEKAGDYLFRIHDGSLSEGIHFGIDTRAPDKPTEEKEALLRSQFVLNQQNGLGMEYVKEVWLGYVRESELQAWNELLGAIGKLDATCWRLSKHQGLRLVKTETRGIQGIACKVRSLDKARQHLERGGIGFQSEVKAIKLDQSQTFGLSVNLVEE